MTEQTPTPESVQNTLRDYLRVATATGELRGTRVEFTADGETWSEVLVGLDIIAARATVHRAGWEIPTVVTALWSESLPAEQTWLDLWNRKGHVLFGAFTLRAALVRTFADVLGDRREPDDLPTGDPVAASAGVVAGGHPNADVVSPASARAAEPVPWLERVAAAQTAEAVDAIRDEARAKRAIDPELHLAMKTRLRDLAAPDAATVAVDEPAAEPTAIAVAMQEATPLKPKPTPLTSRTRATRKQG